MPTQEDFPDARAAASRRFSFKGVGSLAVAAILVVAAILGGAAKFVRHNGGKLGRGAFVAHSANRHFNPLSGPAEHPIPDEKIKESARFKAHQVLSDLPPPRRFVQGRESGDASGIVRDRESDGHITDRLSDSDIRRLYETVGLSVRIASAPFQTEYRGNPNEELSLVASSGVTTLTFNLGPYVIDKVMERDVAPNVSAGEYNKCRVHFGDDGRAFFSISHRFLLPDGGEPFDLKGHYELEVVEGSEEDFRAGKPVLLMFSQEGLRRNQEDCAILLEKLVTPAIQKRITEDPLLVDLANQINISTKYQSFANSMILATPSHIMTEDRQETVAYMRATFPPK